MKFNYQTPELDKLDINVLNVNAVLCQSMVLPGLEEDSTTVEWED